MNDIQPTLSAQSDMETSRSSQIANLLETSHDPVVHAILADHDEDEKVAFDIDGYAEEAAGCMSAPARKVQSVAHPLAVGRCLHNLAHQIRSTKERGICIKKNMPEIAKLGSWFGSDCKWLYEVHIGLRDQDFFSLMGVECMADLKVTHPSVLRRMYRTASKRAPV